MNSCHVRKWPVFCSDGTPTIEKSPKMNHKKSQYATIWNPNSRLLPLRQIPSAPKSASCSSPPARSTPTLKTPSRRSHGTPTVLPLDSPRNHRTHGPQLVGGEFWVGQRRRGGHFLLLCLFCRSCRPTFYFSPHINVPFTYMLSFSFFLFF